MSEIEIPDSTDLGGVVHNALGEPSLFGVNRNVFRENDASSVFRAHFEKNLFEEDAFYIIAGTDSGLLYQYIKAHQLPKESRYLFIELPEILERLHFSDDAQDEIAIVSSDNWMQQAEKMDVKKYALIKRLVLIRSLGVVHGHYSGYYPFWRDIKEKFDAYLQEINNLVSIRPFITCQIENLTENQIPSLCLIDRFKGKTAVVLAGGPSLDDLLPWVKQHRPHLLVIAVSRICRTLITAGITPDIIVSVDPQDFNLYVCKDALEFQDDSLLVNNYHLSPNLLASWGGDKVFIGPRYPWPTSVQPENIPPCGGTTVTNSSLDLAMLAGAAQVVLGGVDFCFAKQGHTHASGTIEHKMGSMPQRCELQVVTNSGEMADTANGYLVSGMYIDQQAMQAAARGCRVINPAPGALKLPHVEYMPLDAIQIEPMDKPACEIIKACVPVSDVKSRSQLYKELLGEIDRLLKDLDAIKSLSSKALIYNRKLFSKTEPDAGYHNKEKVENIENQLIQKYSDICQFIRTFGVSRFVPILRLDDDKYVEDLEVSCRLYHQAMVDTSNDLVELLRLARARVINRREEDNPQPNVSRLIEQWRKDLQPGRAITWANKHQDIVEKLPAKLQKALSDFQNTFQQSVEELSLNYIAQLERESELAGITARAREQFRCNDYSGLSRVLSSLHGHRKPDEAGQYIPLIEGYLAELNEDQESAMSSYENITQGPAYLDALMRMFELCIKKEDWNSALNVLKQMSDVSTTYSPMYADLLYVSGDVDNAVDIYTNYLLENPDDLNGMMKLGRIFMECGSAEGVEWSMNYILSKDPGNHAAQQMLHQVHDAGQAETSHP